MATANHGLQRPSGTTRASQPTFPRSRQAPTCRNICISLKPARKSATRTACIDTQFRKMTVPPRRRSPAPFGARWFPFSRNQRNTEPVAIRSPGGWHSVSSRPSGRSALSTSRTQQTDRRWKRRLIMLPRYPPPETVDSASTLPSTPILANACTMPSENVALRSPPPDSAKPTRKPRVPLACGRMPSSLDSRHRRPSG